MNLVILLGVIYSISDTENGQGCEVVGTPSISAAYLENDKIHVVGNGFGNLTCHPVVTLKSMKGGAVYTAPSLEVTLWVSNEMEFTFHDAPKEVSIGNLTSTIINPYVKLSSPWNVNLVNNRQEIRFSFANIYPDLDPKTQWNVDTSNTLWSMFHVSNGNLNNTVVLSLPMNTPMVQNVLFHFNVKNVEIPILVQFKIQEVPDILFVNSTSVLMFNNLDIPISDLMIVNYKKEITGLTNSFILSNSYTIPTYAAFYALHLYNYKLDVSLSTNMKATVSLDKELKLTFDGNALSINTVWVNWNYQAKSALTSDDFKNASISMIVNNALTTIKLRISCPAGLFPNVFNKTKSLCDNCPGNADCSSNGLQSPVPVNGFFQHASTFVKCPNSEACVNSGCSLGYTGVLCNHCSLSYYKMNNHCINCHFAFYQIIFLFFASTGIVLMIMKFKNIFILHILHLMSLLQFANVQWQMTMNVVYFISSIFTLNVDVIPLDCVFVPYMSKYTINICLIIYVVVVMTLYGQYHQIDFKLTFHLIAHSMFVPIGTICVHYYRSILFNEALFNIHDGEFIAEMKGAWLFGMLIGFLSFLVAHDTISFWWLYSTGWRFKYSNKIWAETNSVVFSKLLLLYVQFIFIIANIVLYDKPITCILIMLSLLIVYVITIVQLKEYTNLDILGIVILIVICEIGVLNGIEVSNSILDVGIVLLLVLFLGLFFYKLHTFVQDQNEAESSTMIQKSKNRTIEASVGLAHVMGSSRLSIKPGSEKDRRVSAPSVQTQNERQSSWVDQDRRRPLSENKQRRSSYVDPDRTSHVADKERPSSWVAPNETSSQRISGVYSTESKVVRDQERRSSYVCQDDRRSSLTDAKSNRILEGSKVYQVNNEPQDIRPQPEKRRRSASHSLPINGVIGMGNVDAIEEPKRVRNRSGTGAEALKKEAQRKEVYDADVQYDHVIIREDPKLQIEGNGKNAKPKKHKEDDVGSLTENDSDTNSTSSNSHSSNSQKSKRSHKR